MQLCLAFLIPESPRYVICHQTINVLIVCPIGWKYYIVFFCLLGLMILLVWFFFPETKGRTLEEVREVLEGPVLHMSARDGDDDDDDVETRKVTTSVIKKVKTNHSEDNRLQLFI